MRPYRFSNRSQLFAVIPRSARAIDSASCKAYKFSGNLNTSGGEDHGLLWRREEGDQDGHQEDRQEEVSGSPAVIAKPEAALASGFRLGKSAARRPLPQATAPASLRAQRCQRPTAEMMRPARIRLRFISPYVMRAAGLFARSSWRLLKRGGRRNRSAPLALPSCYSAKYAKELRDFSYEARDTTPATPSPGAAPGRRARADYRPEIAGVHQPRSEAGDQPPPKERVQGVARDLAYEQTFTRRRK